jgi:uncharacterized protein (TIGR02147 family)
MVANKNLYDFHDYRSYIAAVVGPQNTRKGIRGAIAKVLQCQSTYVSQVLYGRANFSLEQGELLSEFLGHTQDERHYFLLLLQKERAGTKRLEKYFVEQIDDIHRKRMVLTDRLGSKNQLSKENQSIYYSSWQYSAIHVALTVPGLNRAQVLSEFFRIPLKRVSELLTFLCESGLAVRRGEQFDPGTVQMRIGNSSHNIVKHHTNWRNQAVDSLERETISDLHYSGVVSLSQADVFLIKDRLLDFIRDSLKTVRDSKEEELYVLCLDWFSMRKP